MLVKKIITLTAVGFASASAISAVLAGGAEYATVASYAGLYVEGNLGYAHRPWKNDVTTVVGATDLLGLLSASSNANGGFTTGADLGYQFNQYISVEGGWYYLPRITGTVGDVTVEGVAIPGFSFHINSGFAYGALKGAAPIYDNTYVFGKLGVAYTYNNSSVGILNSNATDFVSHSNFWNPMFAAGLQYYFTSNWSANVQYTYVPGYRRASASRFIAPDTQLITAGIGYKFLM